MDTTVRRLFLECLDHDLGLSDADLIKGVAFPGEFPSCTAGPDVFAYIAARWRGAAHNEAYELAKTEAGR